MDHVLELPREALGFCLLFLLWIYCPGSSVRLSRGAGDWHRSGTMKRCWSSVLAPASPLRLGGTWNTCEDALMFVTCRLNEHQ